MSKKLEKFAIQFNRYVAIVIGIVVLAVITLTIIDVSGRWLFNSPLKGGTEVTTAMMSLIVYQSYALCMARRKNIRVDFLRNKYSERGRVLIDLLTDLIGLVVFALLLKGSWGMFAKSFAIKEKMPAEIDFPFWFPKFFAPFGSLLMSLQCIINSIVDVQKLFTTKKKEDETE